MPFSSSELESLHRQIRFLSGEVTRVRHEHDKRLNAKELVILKKNARYERAQKACSKLKIEHSILREEAQTNAHRVVQLKHEIKLLCAEINAMKQRNKDLEEALAANPSAKLRLKIIRSLHFVENTRLEKIYDTTCARAAERRAKVRMYTC